MLVVKVINLDGRLLKNEEEKISLICNNENEIQAEQNDSDFFSMKYEVKGEVKEYFQIYASEIWAKLYNKQNHETE